MKKFIILILAGLLLPAFLLPLSVSAFSYSRIPSGYTITSPVNFDIVIENWEEFSMGCVPTDPEIWTLEISDFTETKFFCSDLQYNLENEIILDLPIDEYWQVWVSRIKDIEKPCGYSVYDGICGFILLEEGYLSEEEEWIPAFEVVEGEEPAIGIFTIPNTTDITGYINDLFAGSGIYPLVALIIGLPLGFFVIKKVVDLKNEKEKKVKLGKLKEPATKKGDWL